VQIRQRDRERKRITRQAGSERQYIYITGGGKPKKKYIGHGTRQYPLVLLVKVACPRKVGLETG
jgi:hypothetical protein